MKVGNYEFTLKNCQYLESRSEETYCFGAILYVNGKKFADCGNGGQGAQTDVRILPECCALGKEIKAFLETQPKIKFDDSDFEMDFDLEHIVDTLVEELIEVKELQKLRNKTKTCLVFKRPDGDYAILGWRKQTIADMLKHPQGKASVKKAIAEQVSKGNILFNENIPAELLPGTNE